MTVTTTPSSKVNSNPGGYIKRTSTGCMKFILTSVSEERGWGMELYA